MRPQALRNSSSRPLPSARSQPSTLALALPHGLVHLAGDPLRACAPFHGDSLGGQSRVNLPGWFGLGQAIEAFLTKDSSPKAARANRALLIEMANDWPFFQTLLSNVDMVLAKVDLHLSRRYASLVSDQRLAQRIFKDIEAEHARTERALNLLTGRRERLAKDPILADSIRHRFPYIDPLNHLQVELIRRHRAGQSDARTQRGIHISINGIAAGLRNTG